MWAKGAIMVYSPTRWHQCCELPSSVGWFCKSFSIFSVNLTSKIWWPAYLTKGGATEIIIVQSSSWVEAKIRSWKGPAAAWWFCRPSFFFKVTIPNRKVRIFLLWASSQQRQDLTRPASWEMVLLWIPHLHSLPQTWSGLELTIAGQRRRFWREHLISTVLWRSLSTHKLEIRTTSHPQGLWDHP